ncbi:related to reductases [Cephalotrichum gorgonifer]|uniref:Related to reductases n=1 Tax=Cephalotrichum gorgonifer TaxID=2041049 RepID=A0AAE8N6M9_9PEZI|nr:related to reductases [Cephalotrichum gorgonifer]
MSRYADVYANPTHPGDARPTALDIIRDEGLVGKLTGKTALVTGGNAGIGIETVRALHAAGATVFLGARTVAKGEAAKADILASDPSNEAPIHVLEMSLDSLASVRAAAASLLSQTPSLNILICNAGVMATPEGRTSDGFETQFGTCHVGHFLLFSLLREALLAGSTPEFNSRVVTVSSIGHRVGPLVPDGDYNFEKTPYEPWRAYGQAKTANIFMANEIERRYGAKGLHGLSLHPGGIKSGLQVHVDPATMASWDESPEAWRSAAQGAATSVYAAVSKEWEGRGGRYLSNCVEMGPMDPNNSPISFADEGYAAWAYDEDAAKTLWKDSCRFVGVEDDL